MDGMIGRTLGARYRVDARIGQGGFGTVYRGTHLRLGDTVAIKTISSPHPGLITRFHREAKLQRRLRHSAIVRLLDFDVEPDGLHYAVQEFVEGRTLKAVLAAEGALDPSRVASFCVPLLEALEEAHGLGIIHRDLKPANMMLTDGLRGEEIRLLDFGIAKLLDSGESSALLTQPHQLIGTLYYMAPEQIVSQPVGPFTDLYQLGCVLYEACGGERAFRGAPQVVLRAHMVVMPPALPERVPPALAAVVFKALQKAPAERFSSAREMRIALLETGLVASNTSVRLTRSGGQAAAVWPDGADELVEPGSTIEQETSPRRAPPRPVAVPVPVSVSVPPAETPEPPRMPIRRLPSAVSAPTRPLQTRPDPMSVGFDDFDFERTGPSFVVPDLGPPLAEAPPPPTLPRLEGPPPRVPPRTWAIVGAVMAAATLLAVLLVWMGL